jgi:hypothetical protein
MRKSGNGALISVDIPSRQTTYNWDRRGRVRRMDRGCGAIGSITRIEFISCVHHPLSWWNVNKRAEQWLRSQFTDENPHPTIIDTSDSPFLCSLTNIPKWQSPTWRTKQIHNSEIVLGIKYLSEVTQYLRDLCVTCCDVANMQTATQALNCNLSQDSSSTPIFRIAW